MPPQCRLIAKLLQLSVLHLGLVEDRDVSDRQADNLAINYGMPRPSGTT